MTKKIRAQALMAAHKMLPKRGRYGLTSALRKYYDVSNLGEQERTALAKAALSCLKAHNQVGYKIHQWYGILEIAALKEPKAEQLKAFETVMSKVKSTSIAQLTTFATYN